MIADWLAEDRLPAINASLEPVVPSKTLYARYGKRGIDIVVSSAALVVTLPINLLCGVITLLDIGRPVFFTQERVGKNGKPFKVVKFRSMTNERDMNGELLPARQRVTKFGRFIRRTSIDELFNFWSILKGDMSIIGPRPLVPEYTHRYNRRHRMRLAVRPGLECPPRHLDQHVWSWQEQFDNDVWYVENLSFTTDVKMVVNLFRFALSRSNSKARVFADRGTFMGYTEEGVAINLDGVPQSYIDKAGEVHAAE